jgi:hypothetical protein
MVVDDEEWLQLTYFPPPPWAGPEALRAQEVERICARRLETIVWPDGPNCPKPDCGAKSEKRWEGARLGLGWRCPNSHCCARFHVLQAIPQMTHTRLPVSIWFRAIYLIDSNPHISSTKLGTLLGRQQKVAWILGTKIRRLRDELPDLVQRIVDGPSADPPPKTNRNLKSPRDIIKNRRQRTTPNLNPEMDGSD